MAVERSEIPRRLPRGSHGLDRRLVAESQRTRLLEAVGRAVAEKGYGGATIDDIVRRAGVSKMTFYEHFRDKEDCFIAAYEAASEELFERVRTAQSGPDGWLERTGCGHPRLSGLARRRPGAGARLPDRGRGRGPASRGMP